jgi:hypothetical protein
MRDTQLPSAGISVAIPLSPFSRFDLLAHLAKEVRRDGALPWHIWQQINGASPEIERQQVVVAFAA